MGERDCPFCGETIKAAARKCRWCGEFLDTELRDRRRRGPERGWALPLAAPILLAVQGLVLLPLAVVCAVHTAEEPVLTGMGILLVAALIYGVLAVTPFGEGCRFRVLLLAVGNVFAVILGVVAINGLNIRPNPPSPLLATLGGGAGLASLALASFVFFVRWNERQAGER